MADETVTEQANQEAQQQARQDDNADSRSQSQQHGEGSDDEGEEFELVLAGNENNNSSEGEGRQDDNRDSEGSDDPEKEKRRRNYKNMQLRLQRRKQRELEEQARNIQSGNIPDHLRVNPNVGEMPNAQDYMNDDALWSKYDGDSAKALAAFNADLAKWNNEALEKRSQSVAEQGRKLQEYQQQQEQTAAAVRNYYDAAEKLVQRAGLADFEQVEEEFRRVAPQGVDVEIMALFEDKAPAMIYHLGKNPQEVARIVAMGPQKAIIELAKLSERLTLRPKKARSNAPLPDEPATGGLSGGTKIDNLRRLENEAASRGDTAKYREYKRQRIEAEKRAQSRNR